MQPCTNKHSYFVCIKYTFYYYKITMFKNNTKINLSTYAYKFKHFGILIRE